MSMPGFSAEASLQSAGHYAQITTAAGDGPRVVPAIPPCHACDDILDMCVRGEARGAVCRYCAAGFCDPQDWRRPPHPFPRDEPWRVAF